MGNRAEECEGRKRATRTKSRLTGRMGSGVFPCQRSLQSTMVVTNEHGLWACKPLCLRPITQPFSWCWQQPREVGPGLSPS